MNITFFKGVITGIILSLPFGPVGFYCMEKTLIGGKKEGYTTAIGMVTSDVIYGLLAFFFINQAEVFILRYEIIFKGLVGICLVALGIKKLNTDVVIKKPDNYDCNYGYIQNFFYGLLLSLLNVAGIVTIVFIYTLLSVVGDSDNYFLLALGIGISGSVSWFLTVQIIIYFKRFINDELLVKLSKISSFIILTFGIVSLGYILFK
ncbi:LysE family transporter [Fusobacterium sp. IOR10]|uniref:LysE family transporter n=1 Tax=Fusobacterium sp. IOR10 TaxID=2665157 RepID=UPI0013D10C04|nr:LysE family transporter [Fusobacterium sp. IOR10]